MESIQARKTLLDYVQEMLETLGPEDKFKSLESLVKMENDENFGHAWLDLFQRIVLVPSGSPTYPITLS